MPLLSFFIVSLVCWRVSAECHEALNLTFQETFLEEATHVNAYDCGASFCAGDQILSENPLLDENGTSVGKVIASCTLLRGLDRAVCKWTLSFLPTDSVLQLFGVSFLMTDNVTEIVVLGGSSAYSAYTGSGTTMVMQDMGQRMFELTLCNQGEVGEKCFDEANTITENEPVNDVIIPATPFFYSTGLVVLFNNALTLATDPNGTKANDSGLCTYIVNKWMCAWCLVIKDEESKIFMQGSICTLPRKEIAVPIIGGTGNYLNARGSAHVIPKAGKAPNSYFLSFHMDYRVGCAMSDNTIRFHFRQNVGTSKVARSKIGNGVSPYVGEERVFIDDLYIVEFYSSKADGIATGTCTLLIENDRHYCEWIIQYPLDGSLNGLGANQIIVVGTVYDSVKTISTVAVVGGSGSWYSAHGTGTYKPLSDPIDDSKMGSPVGEIDITFSYW